jgi:hypothetical protein
MVFTNEPGVYVRKDEPSAASVQEAVYIRTGIDAGRDRPGTTGSVCGLKMTC